MEETTNDTKRNSNIELLRIISMILIIAYHYGIHGFESVEMTTLSFNKYFVDILSLVGKIGVCCFVLISGYYMINSKFTIKKLWKLIGEVIFYSWTILILFLTILPANDALNETNVIKYMFPISQQGYWFITCYIVLMLLSPYLNKFIFHLEKKELINLIFLMTFLWSLCSTFLNADLAYSRIGYFVLLYCIGAYIKLYVKFDDKCKKINKVILFISIFLLILSSILLNYYGYLSDSTYFANENSFLVLIIAVSMFLYFVHKKEYSNSVINNIAKCTLGVYLIHDNEILREYIWVDLLRNPEFYYSDFLVIHAICSIIYIYILCTIIDLIRILLLEPLWLKLYDCLRNNVKIKLNQNL